MNLSDAPKKQPVPFGVNGQREELLATTPAGNQQASYDVGFPAITMLLKSAGGLPPKGQDFNQIFYELASIARWAGAGGNYLFDSAFSTAVSGYPVGATVLSSDGAGFWLNGTNGNTTNPEAADSTLTGWVPVDHVGSTVITGLSASNVTLSSLKAAKDVITLAGTLTANINIILPAWKKKWKIVNNCTGSFTVTVKTFSGTGQTIPSGQEANIRCDGTNISYAELNTKSLFSEISTLGSTSISQALANLGLGEIAKAGVGTGFLSGNGYMKIPLIISGLKVEGIIQWGTALVTAKTTAGQETTQISFPVNFPSSCLQAVATHDDPNGSNALFSVGSLGSGSFWASAYKLTANGAGNAVIVINGSATLRYIAIGY